MRATDMLKKLRQIPWGHLPPFLLLIPLLFAAASLSLGLSCPCLTSLAASVPYPNRLRSPDGISAVIRALGLVGFALSYINSAKASRVKGILLEEVISQCYPRYGQVFLIHGMLALLGLYSCEIDVLQSAWVCLLGMLLCTTYSLCMAFCIAFSPKWQNRLISYYVRGLLSQVSRCKAYSTEETAAEKNRDKERLYKRGRRTAYQLGSYMGERFQADDIHVGRHAHSDQEDVRMLLVALRLLMPEPAEADNMGLDDTESKNRWVGSLPKVFDYLACPEAAEHPECAFFTTAVPKRQAFLNDVRHCATMWDNLLLPVKQEEHRAELAVDVLWQAPTTAALCCGLVYHLQMAYVPSGSNGTGWQTSVRLLSLIFKIVWTSDGAQREKVLRCSTDMMLLMLGLACLCGANSKGLDLSPVFQDLQDLIADAFQRNSGIVCYIPTTTAYLAKYLYFSYLLLLLLAMPRVNLPSRRDLYRQIPVILSAIRQSLGAGRM